VSPALVVHHFGTKDGLLAAVDQHVIGLFDTLLGEMTGEHAPSLTDPQAAGSLAEAVARQLPPDSPVPAYLRRLLLSGGDTGRALFRRLYEVGRAALDAMAAAGMATPGLDPDVRAAFLTANDLAVFLLHDHLADIIGVDPLSTEGMARWAREVLTVYAAGLLTPPTEGSAP
ncbi:MAG TPA: TetR/AcrR family transcriptional regulator, partial [Pseudonocardiaceae bacterium]|nr:TetR/AcrR family transcriptional regulator [Pseudonocardiaceae bacterium]